MAPLTTNPSNPNWLITWQTPELANLALESVAVQGIASCPLPARLEPYQTGPTQALFCDNIGHITNDASIHQELLKFLEKRAEVTGFTMYHFKPHGMNMAKSLVLLRGKGLKTRTVKFVECKRWK